MKDATNTHLSKLLGLSRLAAHSPTCVLAGISKYRLSLLCRKAGAIVLTYDDGPSAYLTERVLDLLGSNEVKATFFNLGTKALEYPGIVERVGSCGHEIGLHGFRHLNAWKVGSRDSIADISEGCAVLERHLSSSRLFRPPCGKITIRTLIELRARGIRPVWWTHDSCDSGTGKLPEVDNFVNSVIQAGGGVVLLHDFDRDGGNPTHPRNEYVIDVSRQLIMKSKIGGFRLMTMGELLYPKK